MACMASKLHAEHSGVEKLLNALEIEQLFHQGGIVRHWIDDLYSGVAQRQGTEVSRSISSAARVRYSLISRVRAKMASVTPSGAGPPLAC